MTTILTRSVDPGAELAPEARWAVGYVGKPLDPRGRAAIAWAKERCDLVIEVEYDNGSLLCAGKQLFPKALSDQIKGKSAVLLEATTLGLVEVLHVMKTAHKVESSQLDILYVEPGNYTDSENDPLQWGRDFSLSDNLNFAAVNGFRLDRSGISRGQIVAFLGFEGGRLRQAIEQMTPEGWSLHAVFGIPGFEPGWDINAFSNNIGAINDQHIWSIHYCAASSVSAAYDLLNSIHNREQWQETPTIVLPMGTKPHGLAASLFLCENSTFQQSGLNYDHPQKKPDRSKFIRKWHLYSVDRSVD